MAKYAKQLAQALTGDAVGNGSDADINGWVDVPSNAKNPILTLVGKNGANLTGNVETIDLNGDVVLYHQKVFAADASEPVSLLNLPFNKVRVRNSGYAAGDLSSALHFSD